MSLPTTPGVVYPPRQGVNNRPARTQRRITRKLMATQSFRMPMGVHWIDFEFYADGASGGNSIATTIGASGGTSGQYAKGGTRVLEGRVYKYTKGVKGAAIGVSGATDGNHATDSSFIGPGVRIVLKGGRAGKADGTAATAIGIVTETTKGYEVFAMKLGGIGETNLAGHDGASTEDVEGGAGGLQPGGGGGGSTDKGKGGKGGNDQLTGEAPPGKGTGAGGGGSGAGNGTTAPGSGAGDDGSFTYFYDL